MTSLHGHEREVAIAQIREFGQTPSQLFTLSHPQRGRGAVPMPSPSAAPPPPSSGTCAHVAVSPVGVPLLQVWVIGGGSRLVALDAALTLRSLPLRRAQPNSGKLSMRSGGGVRPLAALAEGDEGEGEAHDAAAVRSALEIAAGATPVGQVSMRWRAAQLPALASWAALNADGDALYACGSWVNGLHAYSNVNVAKSAAALGYRQQTPGLHAVSCVTVGGDGRTVLAGCHDGSCLLWRPTNTAAAGNGVSVGALAAMGLGATAASAVGAAMCSAVRAPAAKLGSNLAAQLKTAAGASSGGSSGSSGGEGGGHGSGTTVAGNDGGGVIGGGHVPHPPLRLCGHNAPVTCVALQVDLAVALSGSEDGTALMFDTQVSTQLACRPSAPRTPPGYAYARAATIAGRSPIALPLERMHTLRVPLYQQAGTMVRCFPHPSLSPLHAIRITGEGEIILFSADESAAHLVSLNGSALGTAVFRGGRVRAIVATQASAPGFFVFAEDATVTVRRSHDLSEAARLVDAGAPVTCLALHQSTLRALEIVMGFESGRVAIWSVDLRNALVRPPA